VSDVVKVGQITVLLREPPDNTGQVVCGHVVCDVGYASAYRFYTELHKIREALVAAYAVLTARGSEGKTSSAEMHLARLLIELEVTL
jgi:hypothetical protein